MSSDSPSATTLPTAAASLAELAERASVDSRILALLDSVGIETCADLAALDQDAVAVRCGVDGVRLWRLVRGLGPPPSAPLPSPEPPYAEVAWTDYELRDTERLLFVIHGLVGTVCDALRARGEGTRALTLQCTLANHDTVDHTVGAARASASRTAWMRRIRSVIERVRLPDAVTGLAVRIAATEAVAGRQGDVFDRGFATATATEQAIAQLLDARIGTIVAPLATNHPLPERRVTWSPQIDVELTGPAGRATGAAGDERSMRQPAPSLTLQLLPIPRPIAVRTAVRRGHRYPIRYTESAGQRAAIDLLLTLGPDRIAGGQWEDAPHARAYFHCITADGRLVLICRDGDAWSLHGWWD